jgi:Tfp pilus assembly protein PilV
MLNDEEQPMNSEFIIHNSEFRLRRGVTIIEVLFAIMITSVGLLGAIALFPVASSQARKARTNDAVAAAGREAFHMFDTMGMRRVDRWYYWNAGVATPQFAAVPFDVNKGYSYCIDSRFMVRNHTNMPTSASATIKAQFFPYTSPLNAPSAQMNRIAFFPGTLDPTVSTASTYDQFDRLDKYDTTNLDINGGPAYGRNILLADSIFQLEDDLSYLRPGLDDVSKMSLPGITNDRSLPAFQIFPSLTVGKTTAIGTRPILGHLSWMATLVPQIDLAAGQGGDRYLLSIVVFNDRPQDL